MALALPDFITKLSPGAEWRSEWGESFWSERLKTDRAENLRQRADLLASAKDSRSYREMIRGVCALDPLFYVNGFVNTYDLMRSHPPHVPFILLDCQKRLFFTVLEHLAQACSSNEPEALDLVVVKSRDTGMSWTVLTAMDWVMRFLPSMALMVASRNMELVDKTGSPDTLFWKLDYVERNLPEFLQCNPQPERSLGHIGNPVTESVIDGASTTHDIGRAGRRHWLFLDEFGAFEPKASFSVLSATQFASKFRLFGSTPKGQGNAFAQLAHGSCKRFDIDWTEWPEKTKGLYRTDERGGLVILDKTYSFPADYDFVTDGLTRSPYFDVEWERCNHDYQLISQELLRDFVGSGGPFFNRVLLDKMKEECCRAPVHVGNLAYDSEDCEPIRWSDDDKGTIKLWTQLDLHDRPEGAGPFVFGADISVGMGASLSCICGLDLMTGEQVVEYADSMIGPEEFARFAAAFARWFSGEQGLEPLFNYESNGPGGQFGKVFREVYGNIWSAPRRFRSSASQSERTYGCHTSPTNKAILLGDLRDGFSNGSLTPRSHALIEECAHYCYDQNGGVSHSRAITSSRPAAKKANHGDRAMAMVVAWQAVERGAGKPKTNLSYHPEDLSTFAGRRRLARRLDGRYDDGMGGGKRGKIA